MSDIMADIEALIARTLRILLNWVIASVVVIVIGSVWYIFDKGAWPRMVLMVGTGSLLFAQGTLTGFHRGLTVNNRAIAIIQKRRAGGNGGPPDGN